MWYSLERFEDQLAILRDDEGTAVVVDKNVLSSQAKAGDMFRLHNGQYDYDANETTVKKEKIRRLEQLLRSKKQEGNV